ncbi:response regulator [Caloranaerobacter azorensis]|uniref:Response regulator n=1 Tax=Caloranaerobacter azorensis TaxID=116090 RepID=A0A6P1YEL8_9FIRM|nr:response regulator [Caloranaerobacter azorensis]QIB27700.1 response regulator [Caloranaerobacter azorensis]
MRKYRLLCVDDQEGIRVLLGEIFKNDCDVIAVETGSKAIKMITEFKPDIVILDMKLQDMNGEEVLRNIRKIDKRICVVILTGYEDIVQDSSFGVIKPDMIVQKPFDVFELKEKINSLITEYSVAVVN